MDAKNAQTSAEKAITKARADIGETKKRLTEVSKNSQHLMYMVGFACIQKMDVVAVTSLIGFGFLVIKFQC